MSEASALLALQDLDVRLLRLASALSKMPQQSRLKAIALARKKVASELTGIVGRRKDAELEVEETEGDLRYYRDKDARIRGDAEGRSCTHRELKDIEQQLTGLAKRIEKCEYALGPLRDSLGRLERAEAGARSTLERLDSERAREQESLDAGSSDVRAQIVELTRQREAVASELSAGTLRSYEAARARFGGLGVERLRGNVPSVCRVKLQPSQFSDVSHAGPVTECPYCHRILVTEGALE